VTVLPNKRLDPTWGQRRLAPGDRCLPVAAGRRPTSPAAPHPVRSFRWAPRGSSARRWADPMDAGSSLGSQPGVLGSSPATERHGRRCT
jgi:hypothetical protein